MDGFGERLRERRIALDLSQEDVARALHVSRQTVSKWELGKSLPDLNYLIALSSLYQLSLDKLVKGNQSIMKELWHQKAFKETKQPGKTFYADILEGMTQVVTDVQIEMEGYSEKIASALLMNRAILDFHEKEIIIKSKDRYRLNWQKNGKTLKVIPYSDIARIEIGILRSIRVPNILAVNLWYGLFMEIKTADGVSYKAKSYDLALLPQLILKFKDNHIKIVDPLNLEKICDTYEGEVMISYIKAHYDKLILGTEYPAIKGFTNFK